MGSSARYIGLHRALPVLADLLAAVRPRHGNETPITFSACGAVQLITVTNNIEFGPPPGLKK